MKKINRILLVSKFTKNSDQYTYASSFFRILTNLGYTVAAFNCHITLSNSENFVSSYIFKKSANIFINYKLKNIVAKFKPDLLFFIKADTISHKTLASLKQKNKFLMLNFYTDNPFSFWNGNSNKSVLYSLPLYDYFLIWSNMLIPALESAGAKKVLYFPFAYEASLFSYYFTPSHHKHNYDVCFVGTWDCEREQWLTQLVKQRPQLKIAVWGNEWRKNLAISSPLKNVLQGNATYGSNMINVYQSSKIVLNFIRKQNITAHNMRTFEIPSCKAFQLTQRTEEQAEILFKEGESIECFSSLPELVKKIDFYINEDSKRRKISENGYNIAKKYTLEKQLIKLMALLNKSSSDE